MADCFVFSAQNPGSQMISATAAARLGAVFMPTCHFGAFLQKGQRVDARISPSPGQRHADAVGTTGPNIYQRVEKK